MLKMWFDAIIGCLDSKKTARKEYNLPGGDIVTFKEILTIIAKQLDLKRTVFSVPNICSRVGIYAYEAVFPNPVVRKYQVLKWILNKPLSLEKQKEDFNYKSNRFSGRELLKQWKQKTYNEDF